MANKNLSKKSMYSIASKMFILVLNSILNLIALKPPKAACARPPAVWSLRSQFFAVKGKELKIFVATEYTLIVSKTRLMLSTCL